MTSNDIESALDSVIVLVESLTKEVAELVRDTKGNVLPQYRQEVLKRADELISASRDMRQSFDKSRDKSATVDPQEP